ncbi:MFS transporter [Pantanalinema rosaneae CENA516]|uniref:MFS transporter n=1 Tax=Pantanalinema rosaneae TaxID=1620701 RepID=UPI003D6FB1A1
MEFASVEAIEDSTQVLPLQAALPLMEPCTDGAVTLSEPPPKLTKARIRPLTTTLNTSKDKIRTSLEASTFDGVFATLFSNVTGGVLLTNFLLKLGANPTEIGMLMSIPMLANLVQPIGAYFSEKTTSRHLYCLWIYGISRSLWLGLVIGIFFISSQDAVSSVLIGLTLATAGLSYFLGALGSAPWLSWMAVLVPRQLRGRYFGLRNSAATLTNLISVPLMGWMLSKWFSGSIAGYGVILLLGIVAGLVSLWFQNFMVDVNPQAEPLAVMHPHSPEAQPVSLPSDRKTLLQSIPFSEIWQNSNFLKFLLYFNFWTFAVNLSTPFFNLYMLDNLNLDISQVTLYNSLMAGANLATLVLWGKLADRIGNRPILLVVGIAFALTPLLWLITDAQPISFWLWLPLLHFAIGGTSAAIDLCASNLQLGVAPIHNQSTYFGVVAAFAGISGALGTTAGGFLAQFGSYGGLLGLFALSAMLRLGALLPLIFVREERKG